MKEMCDAAPELGGFLRLSLVSCPIYLSPATTRMKPSRLHRVWQPARVDEDEDELLGRDKEQQTPVPTAPQLLSINPYADEYLGGAATRITLRPHDPETGDEVDKREVVKGYEYGRGQFVAFTAEKLRVLDVESSNIIDLDKFVSRAELDPIYFDSLYYIYPDGPIAIEALRGHRHGDA
jgi:non-homologous end joining protein Ku